MTAWLNYILNNLIYDLKNVKNIYLILCVCVGIPECMYAYQKYEEPTGVLRIIGFSRTVVISSCELPSWC